jgi:hypothetical protein
MRERRARSVVLRPIKPELAGVNCQLVLAYKRQPPSELIRPFVTVVREVAAERRRKRAARKRPALTLRRTG